MGTHIKKPKDPIPKQLRRFSKADIELAHQISNDIAEGIDAGETRRQLRMTVDYYATVLCYESAARAALEGSMEISKLAYDMMGAVLSSQTKKQ